MVIGPSQSHIPSQPHRFPPLDARIAIAGRGHRLQRIEDATKRLGALSPDQVSSLRQAIWNPATFTAPNKKLGATILRKADPLVKLSAILAKYLAQAIRATDKSDFSFSAELPPLTSRNPTRVLEKFEAGEPIPRHIRDFDTSAPHTIPAESYVNSRLSPAITQAIQFARRMKQPTEIFIGSREDMETFYQAKGYERKGRIGTESANLFFAYEHRVTKQPLIVVSGVANRSRLNHLLLQLKFAGVDLDHVKTRGSFQEHLTEGVRILNHTLSSFDPPPRLAFIGNRTQIVIALAERLYPEEMKQAEDKEQTAETLLQAHGHHHVKINDLFSFSYFKAPTPDGEIGVIGFRMPHGNLAYEATKSLLDAGIERLVMVGAGGSLDKAVKAGSYQMITESTYSDGENMQLPFNKIVDYEVPNLTIAENRANLTVDSPLEQTNIWLRRAKAASQDSSDSETFHIFKAINSSPTHENFRVFPGLFTSDVIGVDPLQEKISADKALIHLSDLVQAAFDEQGIVRP